MNQSSLPHDIWELFDAACDGALVGPDVERLQTLLETPEVRQLYVSYCRMHADLHFRIRADQAGRRGLSVAMQFVAKTSPASTNSDNAGSADIKPATAVAPGNATRSSAPVISAPGISAPVIPAPLPPSEESQAFDSASSAPLSSWFSGGWRSATFFCLGAIATLAIVGLWLSSNQYRAQQTAALPVTPATQAAAYLTMANGCNWGGSSPDMWTVGRSIGTGDEITLYEGIAEFRLASGVSLSIEGPTALVLTSANSLVLQHGRVTAYVPWEVTDFKLITSACRLAASNAEFGVSATGGEVDIHAFSGEVLATPAFDKVNDIDSERANAVIEREAELGPDADFASVYIREGRSLSIVEKQDRVRVSRWHAADESQFATKLSMGGGLPIGEEYVRCVRQSQPNSYWRFESSADDTVLNEVDGACGLKAIGPLRLVGNSQNRVVELGRPGSDSFLLSDRALDLTSDDYSIEMWIKPSHVHSSGVFALLADGQDQPKDHHAVYLQLLGTGRQASLFNRDYPSRIRLLHRNPPGTSSYTGTSCISAMPYTLRRWQHIVGRKEGEQLQLYVDGVQVAQAKDKTPLAKYPLRVLVGQALSSRRVLPFVGQLDELAIYDHALSEEEIVRHFRSVRWKSVPIKRGPKDS